MAYSRISSLKSAMAFQNRLAELRLQLPLDEIVASGKDSTLGQPYVWDGGTIGNRFAILPMEGWDGSSEGKPTTLTRRRWKNFGLSGAKLIWGGEAVAVRHDGRANPNQLLLNDMNAVDIEGLRELLVATHEEHFTSSVDLLVGLQLTHSGRFARPNDKKRLEPIIAYRHPILDRKLSIPEDAALLSDDALDRLVEDFVRAAKLAEKLGYAFVDIKHCHGYLGHELLSGWDRPGRYGGCFENRTRFLTSIVAGIRSEAPRLQIGSRVSIFDFVPFQLGAHQVGVPCQDSDYQYAFGGDGSGQGIDLTEPSKLMCLFEKLGINLVCTTAGSPYYNPHIQRPALFPPSDGYQPPEDPLVGVTRQILAAAELKRKHPKLTVIGTGYSYLQEWLPHVAQAVVRKGMVDFVGLGRMVLSYPDLPADVLAGRTMVRNKICRTFSDCTTGPRNGMISGCFPLDPFYKAMPEREQLVKLKKSKGD